MTDAAAKTDTAEAAPPEPRKRRGRPKGLGKVPGSGRPARPRTIQQIRAHILQNGTAYLDNLIAIAAGGEVKLSGPTGKPLGLGRAPIADQIKAASELNRIVGYHNHPIEFDATIENTIRPDTDPRDLARTVLAILSTAKLEKVPKRGPFEEAEIEDDGSDGAPPFRAVDGAAGDCSGSPAAAGPTPEQTAGAVERAALTGSLQNYHSSIAQGRSAELNLPDGWSRPGLPVADKQHPTNNALQQPTIFTPGERVLIDGCKGWLQFRYRLNDGREGFWLCNRHGDRVCGVLGREVAEAKLKEYEKTGKVSV